MNRNLFNTLSIVIGPKVRGFKPAEDDRFLMAIKIRSTTSFGGEVKPSAHVRFYGMLKNPTGMKDTSEAKFTAISCQDPPASLPGVFAGYCQRALQDES
jgi:hypothetical protein